MKKVVKIILLLTIILACFVSLIIILYYRGIKEKSFVCTYDKLKLELHSLTNDNCWQGCGYDLKIRIINAKANKSYDLGFSENESVKIEIPTIENGGIVKKVIVITVLGSGNQFMIDRENLDLLATGSHVLNYKHVLQMKKGAVINECTE